MTTPADLKTILGSMAGRRIIAQEIADALGISRNAANDRMNRGLEAGDLITVARELEINPVDVLVELNHITHAEVFDFMDSDGTLLATATEAQLHYQLAEVTLTKSEKLRLVQGLVTDEDDELAARRSNKNAGSVGAGSYDGTVKDFDWSQPHAADSSPDEQAEREKRGEDPID